MKSITEIRDLTRTRNLVEQIHSNNEKRYKEYEERIDSLEKIEMNYKKYITKLSAHIVALYCILTAILIKVW